MRLFPRRHGSSSISHEQSGLSVRDATILRWLGRHELGSLVVFGLFALSVFCFIKVASEVSEGDVQSIDRKLILALRNPHDLGDPIGPAWVEEMGRDFSALGGAGVLSLATLGVAGYFVLSGRRWAAAVVVAAVGGVALLSELLKDVFGRPRPEIVPRLAHVTSSSFPSGHSMLAAAVYLTIGALLARLEGGLVMKAYLLASATVVVVLVGVSRVYLGVHWPSDVLAGWAAGAAWACLCWFGTRRLQRSGMLDRAVIDASSMSEARKAPAGEGHAAEQDGHSGA